MAKKKKMSASVKADLKRYHALRRGERELIKSGGATEWTHQPRKRRVKGGKGKSKRLAQQRIRHAAMLGVVPFSLYGTTKRRKGKKHKASGGGKRVSFTTKSGKRVSFTARG